MDSASKRRDLPTVRLQKIEICDYKGVEYGEILLNAGKPFGPYGEGSNLLGLYGPNGSGKSSLIEVMEILKSLLSGARVDFEYANHVRKGAEYAKIAYTFDFQYPGGDRLTVIYEVKLRESDKESIFNFADLGEDSATIKSILKLANMSASYETSRVEVCAEKLQAGGTHWGKTFRSQTIIDTSSDDVPFKPASKRTELGGSTNDALITMGVNKRSALKESRSFIFMDESLELFNSSESQWYEVIDDLNRFGSYYLFIINSNAGGAIRSGTYLPIYMRGGQIRLPLLTEAKLPAEAFDGIQSMFERENTVLSKIVPGLSVFLTSTSTVKDEEGKEIRTTRVMVRRGGVEIPFSNESDGIKRLISMLHVLVLVFGQQSTTVAIDEIDSGIFEYLLGELLLAFQEAGKGQLIFTSHNLRPLEVLDKKFIHFTTTSPDNRYIQLRGVHSNNNLRNTYFRDLLIDDQEEPLYDATRRQRIITALRGAYGDVEE